MLFIHFNSFNVDTGRLSNFPPLVSSRIRIWTRQLFHGVNVYTVDFWWLSFFPGTIVLSVALQLRHLTSQDILFRFWFPQVYTNMASGWGHIHPQSGQEPPSASEKLCINNQGKSLTTQNQGPALDHGNSTEDPSLRSSWICSYRLCYSIEKYYF